MGNEIKDLPAALARIKELETLLEEQGEKLAELQEAGKPSERELKIRERMLRGGRSLTREQAELAVDHQTAEDARREKEKKAAKK